MSELTCARMRELAPELALEVLTGYERATAQRHLGTCQQCREYVASLTQIGDRMLTLVPGVEPPVGFEDTVLAGMGFPGRETSPPRRRWWPIAVAAAAAALVFGLGGWVIGGMTAAYSNTVAAGGTRQQERFATLRTSGQQQIGEVFITDSSPAWVWMSVTTDAHTAWVSCQLLEQTGQYVPVGTFPLSGGKGGWGGPLKVDPTTLVGARLLSDHGTVLATATFARLAPHPLR